MNTYDYQRQMNVIPTMTGYPGAKRAVAEPMTRVAGAEMGQFDIQKSIDALNRLRSIEQEQSELNMEKESLGLMGKEYGRGVAGTIGAIGLEGLGAWETKQMNIEEEKRQQKFNDMMNLIMQKWQQFPDLFRQRFMTNLEAIYKRPFPKTLSQTLYEPVVPKSTPQFGGSNLLPQVPIRNAVQESVMPQLNLPFGGGNPQDNFENNFQKWYGNIANKWGLNPNPDDPLHFYDYRAAYRSGDMPDSTGHWPSRFKKPGHPNRYINGIDTITGEFIGGGR